MEAERIREGVKLMQQGDKASTNGFFRNPDWDLAASSFEKAATSFKIARSYDQAVIAYTRTSEAYFKADGIHLAGKAMENAGFLLSQYLNQPQRAAEAYRQASDLFMADGKIDRAAEELGKAARSMESIDVNAAIELYSSACSLFEQEDRGRFSQEIFKKAISLSVKSRKYVKAVELIRRQSTVLQKLASRSHLYMANLSLLIVLFALDDEVEAGKQFNTMCANDPGFAQSEEANIGQSLLQAYDKLDQRLLEKTVRLQQVSFLDNEVVKLSRTLTVPGESLSSTQPTLSSYRGPSVKLPHLPAPSQSAYNHIPPSRPTHGFYDQPPSPLPQYSDHYHRHDYPAKKQHHQAAVVDDEGFNQLNPNSAPSSQSPKPNHTQHPPPAFDQNDDDDDDLR